MLVVIAQIKPNSKVGSAHCCRYSGGDFHGPSRSKGLEGWFGGRGSPGMFAVWRSYSPKISFACCNPFDNFFCFLILARGGEDLSSGIQFITEAVMLPSFPQRTMRWSSSGFGELMMGRLDGMIGGLHGVVIRWVLGGWSSGFSAGRASLNPGLGSQAEGVGAEFSRRTFVCRS